VPACPAAVPRCRPVPGRGLRSGSRDVRRHLYRARGDAEPLRGRACRGEHRAGGAGDTGEAAAGCVRQDRRARLDAGSVQPRRAGHQCEPGAAREGGCADRGTALTGHRRRARPRRSAPSIRFAGRVSAGRLPPPALAGDPRAVAAAAQWPTAAAAQRPTATESAAAAGETAGAPTLSPSFKTALRPKNAIPPATSEIADSVAIDSRRPSASPYAVWNRSLTPPT